MIDCERIAQALAEYDPDAQEARVVSAEEQRSKLIALFPKDGWPSMTLDRYALGQRDHPDNFCRWMEFVTADMGSIKGGNARKHLIYFQAATGQWWFDQKLFRTVDDAWEAVHEGFLEAIEYAETGRWDEIETIAALRSAPALVNKTLWAYFPEDLLPINSQRHLRHYMQELSDPMANDQSLGTIKLNRALLEGLRACDELEGWTTHQMAYLLYSTRLNDGLRSEADAIKQDASTVGGRRAWMVRAWDGARYRAPEFSQTGRLVLGYPPTGDVSGLDLEAITSAVTEAHPERNAQAWESLAEQLDIVVNRMHEGDIIVTPTGPNAVEAIIGVVTGPYEFVDPPPVHDWQQTRTVDWKKTIQGSLLPLAVQRTLKAPRTVVRLIDVEGLLRLIEGGVEIDADRANLSVELVRGIAEAQGLLLDDRIYATLVAAIRSGKHVVLTGPPGTAKTTLAQIVAEAAQQVGLCRGALLTTATADWTTYETIGGLRPVGLDRLEFSPGFFLEAIAGHRWLVIDELNRSNFDRAFGQLFTVLSGQPVVLPYEDASSGLPVALVPDGATEPPGCHVIRVPSTWQVIATMNVFDKSLLFEMSFALMRRFAFIEVAAPADGIFDDLIAREADGSELAQRVAHSLLSLRSIKDMGPALFMDLARFGSERDRIGGVTVEDLTFQGFFSFLLPQFEGIEERQGGDLYAALRPLVGAGNRADLLRVLHDVLGLELTQQRRITDDAPDALETQPAEGDEEGIPDSL